MKRGLELEGQAETVGHRPGPSRFDLVAPMPHDRPAFANGERSWGWSRFSWGLHAAHFSS